MKSPQIVIVSGLPGVGKSTVARRIADRIDASVVQTDAVRKSLFEHPTYSSQETTETYSRMFQMAESYLEAGSSVVLDATFSRGEMRDWARDLAARHCASYRLVLVTAPDSRVRQRLSARRNDVSDADYAVHCKMKAEFEPVDRPDVEIVNWSDLRELDSLLEIHFPSSA